MSHHATVRGSAGRLAGGLGWASIGLGLLEIAAARPIARGLGMRGLEGLVAGYGLREIATGIGVLTARERRPWIVARLAGDALDVATLLAATPGNRRPAGLALGLVAVAGITMLDLVCAEALRTEESRLTRHAGAIRDMSGRSGFPQGAGAMRGAARDAGIPGDFRTPEALRPWATA